MNLAGWDRRNGLGVSALAVPTRDGRQSRLACFTTAAGTSLRLGLWPYGAPGVPLCLACPIIYAASVAALRIVIHLQTHSFCSSC